MCFVSVSWWHETTGGKDLEESNDWEQMVTACSYEGSMSSRLVSFQ